jgi:pimeloyl-ACP methyl ester carboxylesterase
MDQGRMPVVFVHGLRTSRTMWRAQVGAVEAAGHRATAVDLPGHGRRFREPFTVEGAVDAVHAAVEDVGGRALVVGLSLGGYVGIAHAARHPDQVAGLLAASCCRRPRRAVVRVWGLGSRAILCLPDRGAGLNGFLVDHVLPAAGAADARAGGFALDVMTSVLGAMAGVDVLADLRRVEAPVWLVNGRFDHFRGEERAFLGACRDGRLVVVPGATHLVSLVRPTRFSRVVLEALAVVDQRESATGHGTGAEPAGAVRGVRP